MDFSSEDYLIFHNYDKIVDKNNYSLHNHYGRYEIFVFLKGNAEYIVEGSVYPLERYDIILLNPNEFHRIVHHDTNEYERIVLDIRNTFFSKNDCEIYKDIFNSRKLGTKNLIPSKFVIENNIPEILSRMEKYISDKNNDIPVKCTLLELLHVINKYQHSDKALFSDEKILKIMMYINENISEPITIDDISNRFYINKYYLCRLFKQHTGLTVNKYITHKRILKVKNLCNEGYNITEASYRAGFGNYSNFYRMYLKETGHTPKEDMK